MSPSMSFGSKEDNQHNPSDELTFREGREEDIDLLVDTRIYVLRNVFEVSPEDNMGELKDEVRNYYLESFKRNNHVSFFACYHNEIVGYGAISFYQVMPCCDTPTGVRAYIGNMYTEETFRKRGIATQILSLLVEEARRRNVKMITLETTEAGRDVYFRFGFKDFKDLMVLSL